MACKLEQKFKNVEDLNRDLKGFSCIKKLGGGGFGETFLFKDKKDKKLAVKAIYKNSRDVVMNEVKILKKIKKSCTNVLCHEKVLNYSDTSYIITEFIDGESMFDFYRHKSVPNIFIKTTGFVCQLLKAIEYLHSIDIIHFDIKPLNVMITNSNQLKLIDFGAAVYSPNRGTVTQLVITKDYLPRGTKKMIIPFKEGMFRDYYAFLKTFLNRKDDGSPITQIKKRMSVTDNLITLEKLFDTKGINLETYERRIEKIKHLVCEEWM